MSTYTDAAQEWNSFIASTSPEERLRLYQSAWEDGGEPQVAKVSVGWSPGDGDPEMLALFAKVNSGTLLDGQDVAILVEHENAWLAQARDALSASGGAATVGVNGVGLLILVGLGLYLLSRNR